MLTLTTAESIHVTWLAEKPIRSLSTVSFLSKVSLSWTVAPRARRLALPWAGVSVRAE